MKKKIEIIISVVCLLLVVGLGACLFYPYITRTVNNIKQEKQYEEYNKEIKKAKKNDININNQSKKIEKNRNYSKVLNATQNYNSNNMIKDYNKKSKKNTKTKTLSQLKENIIKYNKKIYEEGQGNLNENSYKKASFDLKQYGISSSIYGYLTISKI